MSLLYQNQNKFTETWPLLKNTYDPCLFSGNIIDPSDPSDSPLTVPLTRGLYVEDFIYFSADNAVKAEFQRLLKQHVMIDFMGRVEWFLGTHFLWSVTPTAVKVHLSQTSFAYHLVEDNNIHHRNITPGATPYCSGLPIDACPELDKDKESSTFLDR